MNYLKINESLMNLNNKEPKRDESSRFGSKGVSCPLELSAGKIKIDSIFSESSPVRYHTIKGYIESDLEISDHLKSRKPDNDYEFSHYLAGLIEGNGIIRSKIIEINFHLKDITTAFYIKKRIGYGKVITLKQEKLVKYIVRDDKGLNFIIDLVNGKFLAQDTVNKLILMNYFKNKPIKILPPRPLSLDNYWLAGFTDALGSFNINLVTENQETDILLSFHLKNKDLDCLQLINNEFSGKIESLNNSDYIYYTENYSQVKNFIDYFDQYHLLSASKYTKYTQ